MSDQQECVCEGEFPEHCGEECDCFHHGPTATDELRTAPVELPTLLESGADLDAGRAAYPAFNAAGIWMSGMSAAAEEYAKRLCRERQLRAALQQIATLKATPQQPPDQGFEEWWQLTSNKMRAYVKALTKSVARAAWIAARKGE